MFRPIQSHKVDFGSFKKDVYRGFQIGIHSTWIGHKPDSESPQAVKPSVPQHLDPASDTGRNPACEHQGAQKQNNQRSTSFHKPVFRIQISSFANAKLELQIGDSSDEEHDAGFSIGYHIIKREKVTPSEYLSSKETENVLATELEEKAKEWINEAEIEVNEQQYNSAQ